MNDRSASHGATGRPPASCLDRTAAPAPAIDLELTFYRALAARRISRRQLLETVAKVHDAGQPVVVAYIRAFGMALAAIEWARDADSGRGLDS